MRNWFISNRIILIGFVISSILLTIFAAYTLQVIANHLDVIKYFVDTGIYVDALNPVLIALVATGFILLFWIFFSTVLIWKVIFPTNKHFKEAMHVNDIQFLLSIPNELRKGMNKHE